MTFLLTNDKPAKDIHIAKEFAEKFSSSCQYKSDPVRPMWYVWNGILWEPDPFEDLVMRKMETHLTRRLGEVSRLPPSPSQKRYVSLYTGSQTYSRIRGIIKIASHNPLILHHPEEWDMNPHLLNLPNGTYNLQTLKLRPHRREDFITRVTAVPYTPSILPGSEWEKVVKSKLPSPIIREYFQRYCAYCLYGTCSEDRFILIHGPTRSGKTTLCSALESALGTYAKVLNKTALLESSEIRGGSHRTDLYQLRGIRLALCAEISPDQQLSIQLMNSLMGGEKLSYRTHYGTEVEWKNTTKLILYSNEFPKTQSAGDAFWARAIAIPFNASLPEDRIDKEIRFRLNDPKKGGPSVLAWMIAGLPLYHSKGLRDIPPTVIESSREWKDDSISIVKEWTSAFLKKGKEKEDKIPSGKLYKLFAAHQQASHVRNILSYKRFIRDLRSLGFLVGRDSHNDNWSTIFGVQYRKSLSLSSPKSKKKFRPTSRK